MNHFYQSIGAEWFNFQGLYRRMVQRAPYGQDTVFVELGVYKGASTSFMGVEIANSRKSIDFFAVDQWWEGIEEIARKNLEPVKDYVNLIQSDSSAAADRYFRDQSVDFLYIDAGHDYHEVRADINAWLPKMKPNSIIAGHDYSAAFPGVMQAVSETWPNAVRIVDWYSWMVELKNGKPVSNV
jgi:predicted O-methyltransferase YrrM